MKSFKFALAVLASVFTISSAHAEHKYHYLKFQGGLPVMIMFVGAETPIAAYQNNDHADLVRYAWDKSDGRDDSDGTYHDYFYCDSTKPNQPIGQMTCHAEFDENSPSFQLFKNDVNLDKK